MMVNLVKPDKHCYYWLTFQPTTILIQNADTALIFSSDMNSFYAKT